MNFSFLNGFKNPKKVLNGFKNPKEAFNSLKRKDKVSSSRDSILNELKSIRRDKCSLYDEIIGYIRTIGDICYNAGCSAVNVSINGDGMLEIMFEGRKHSYTKNTFNCVPSEVKNILTKYIEDNSIDVFVNIGLSMNKLHDIFENIWKYPDNGVVVDDAKICMYQAKFLCTISSDNKDFLYAKVERKSCGPKVSCGVLMSYKAIIKVYRQANFTHKQVIDVLLDLSKAWRIDITFDDIRELIREYGGCCYCYHNCCTYYVGKLRLRDENCIIICSDNGDMYMRKASDYRDVAGLYRDKLMDPFIRDRPIDPILIGPENGIIREGCVSIF